MASMLIPAGELCACKFLVLARNGEVKSSLAAAIKASAVHRFRVGPVKALLPNFDGTLAAPAPASVTNLAPVRIRGVVAVSHLSLPFLF